MIASPVGQEVGPFIPLPSDMSSLNVVELEDDFTYLLDASFCPPALAELIPLSAIVYFFRHIYD